MTPGIFNAFVMGARPLIERTRDENVVTYGGCRFSIEGGSSPDDEREETVVGCRLRERKVGGKG